MTRRCHEHALNFEGEHDADADEVTNQLDGLLCAGRVHRPLVLSKISCSALPGERDGETRLWLYAATVDGMIHCLEVKVSFGELHSDDAGLAALGDGVSKAVARTQSGK